MSQANQNFIDQSTAAALAAGHVWPAMAACEAALETEEPSPSGPIFGASQLATRDLNLFGMKQHTHPIYGTAILPTKEYSNTMGWYTVDAKWVVYPNWEACFKDRMDTLERLKGTYPHYAAALTATDPITYIQQVSLTWSTGPKRAQAVIDIYNEYCK